MKILEIKSKAIDLTKFSKRSALNTDFAHLITESTIITEDGKIKIIYKKLDDEPNFDSQEIVEALKRIEYDTNERTGGLKTTSRIFGYSPRNVLRKDFCSSTSLAREFPKEHEVVCRYGVKVAELYQENDPVAYSKHMKLASKVLPEWTIEDSPFTSGIINKNNPLKYHFDSGNFKDVYSCMLGFKQDVESGYLSIPAYDIALEIGNNSVTIFDGQSILHGVTPIKYLKTSAYRYTIVYYSLKQMWNCLPLGEEIGRIRNLKTNREMRRAEQETFSKIR